MLLYKRFYYTLHAHLSALSENQIAWMFAPLKQLNSPRSKYGPKVSATQVWGPFRLAHLRKKVSWSNELKIVREVVHKIYGLETCLD